jgi:hypothetical protein
MPVYVHAGAALDFEMLLLEDAVMLEIECPAPVPSLGIGRISFIITSDLHRKPSVLYADVPQAV